MALYVDLSFKTADKANAGLNKRIEGAAISLLSTLQADDQAIYQVVGLAADDHSGFASVDTLDGWSLIASFNRSKQTLPIQTYLSLSASKKRAQ